MVNEVYYRVNDWLWLSNDWWVCECVCVCNWLFVYSTRHKVVRTDNYSTADSARHHLPKSTTIRRYRQLLPNIPSQSISNHDLRGRWTISIEHTTKPLNCNLKTFGRLAKVHFVRALFEGWDSWYHRASLAFWSFNSLANATISNNTEMHYFRFSLCRSQAYSWTMCVRWESFIALHPLCEAGVRARLSAHSFCIYEFTTFQNGIRCCRPQCEYGTERST